MRTTRILRVDPESGEERVFESIRAAADELSAETVMAGGIARGPESFSGNIVRARNRRVVAHGYFWVGARKRVWRAALAASIAEGGK